MLRNTLLLCLLAISFLGHTQIVIDDFNAADLNDGWSESAVDLSIENGSLKVVADQVGGVGEYKLFFLEFDALDMSRHQTISVKVKIPSSTSVAPQLRFDLRDNNGYDANAAPPIITPEINDNFVTYTLSFKNRFRSVWPQPVLLDPANIIRFSVYINANFGDPFTGTFYIDDIILEGAQDKHLIQNGETWTYSTSEETSWNDTTFTGTWPTFTAPASYNNDGVNSTIDSTLTGGSAISSLYLRKSFNLLDSVAFPNVILETTLDDAAVIYLNGQELKRFNTTDGINANSERMSVQKDSVYRHVFGIDLLDSGENVVAVKLLQATSEAEQDLFFDLRLTGTRYDTAIVRGPYLQSSSDTSIIVIWRTLQAQASHIVYGTSLDQLNTNVEDQQPSLDHQVQITDLLPATKYYYAILDEAGDTLAGGSSEYYFLTHPTTGSENPYRFWVIGDAGRSTTEQKAVMTAYQAFNGSEPTAAWLLLGDNAYNEGTDSEYQRAMFENMFESEMIHTTIFPTPGNHDLRNYGPVMKGIVDAPYFDIFEVPTKGESGGLASGTESYYSFDYGNVHFISLDSYGTSLATTSEMATWLENDLAANTNKWVVAYWHHPPHSKGSHDSDLFSDSHGIMYYMRQNIMPILENGGADLVLTGHSHVYERSYLSHGFYGLSNTLPNGDYILYPQSEGSLEGTPFQKNPSEGNIGTVFAVVGCSGSATSHADWEDQPDNYLTNDFMHMSTNDHVGSFVLDIHADTLKGLFLNNTGVIIDDFAIIKNEQAEVKFAEGVGVRLLAGPSFKTLSDHNGQVQMRVTYETDKAIASRFIYTDQVIGEVKEYHDPNLRTEHSFIITIDALASYDYIIMANEFKAVYSGEEIKSFSKALGTHNHELHESVKLFPNPVSNKQLKLELPHTAKVEVYLLNELGEELAKLQKAKKVTKGVLELELPNELQAGNYLVEIIIDGEKIVKQLVVE